MVTATWRFTSRHGKMSTLFNVMATWMQDVMFTWCDQPLTLKKSSLTSLQRYFTLLPLFFTTINQHAHHLNWQFIQLQDENSLWRTIQDVRNNAQYTQIELWKWNVIHNWKLSRISVTLAAWSSNWRQERCSVLSHSRLITADCRWLSNGELLLRCIYKCTNKFILCWETWYSITQHMGQCGRGVTSQISEWNLRYKFYKILHLPFCRTEIQYQWTYYKMLRNTSMCGRQDKSTTRYRYAKLERFTVVHFQL